MVWLSGKLLIKNSTESRLMHASTRKDTRQLEYCWIRPPNTGAMAGESWLVMANQEKPLFNAASSTQTSEMMTLAMTGEPAVPSAVIKRARYSISIFCAAAERINPMMAIKKDSTIADFLP